MLTDLSLPDSVGLETVSRIRAHDAGLPIIVLTTLDDQRLELSTLTVGAQDYLLKDEATPHALTRAIHHAIQRQECLGEIQRLLSEVGSQREALLEQQSLLRRKNRRLRNLYRTAQRFVDNVSHEFRTPLTVIKDYVSLVREGMVGAVNSEQQRMLDIANVRADDLNNMVDDMLDVSKLEAGLLGVWRRPCRLDDIFESVCPPLRRKAEIKGITFEVDATAATNEVYCDAEKIGRVIINLVTNAMKFCGQPGEVRLTARRAVDGEELIVEVADNGPGIEPAALDELFQRFRQLGGRRKTVEKGFGLGLNIAKELVSLNFGALGVRSQLGEGSTFHFSVPLNHPGQVMRRYLERASRMRGVDLVVALAQVDIDPGATEDETEDMDAFFNALLRRHDLLFRVAERRWLFALAIPRAELSEFSSRASRVWDSANRNRPCGPLPTFAISLRGAWSPTTAQSEALAGVEALLDASLAEAVGA